MHRLELAVAALLLAAVLPAADDPAARAAAAPWRFDPSAATIDASIAAVPRGYAARRSVDDGGRPVTTISADGRDRFSWVGWSGTVFAIADDHLYAVMPNEGGQGGMVIAADLRSGTLVWAAPLVGLPPVGHSKYANRVNLAVDHDDVRITGQETSGRYLEIKSAHSGGTIGLHRYDEAPAPR